MKYWAILIDQDDDLVREDELLAVGIDEVANAGVIIFDDQHYIFQRMEMDTDDQDHERLIFVYRATEVINLA